MPRAGTYNRKRVGEKVAKSIKFKRANLKNAQRKARIENKKLLKNFKSHEVTQEIEGGPGGVNSSNTLGGRGNLFTYIGFERGGSPTQEVENIIRRSGQNTANVKSTGKRRVAGNKIKETFKVKGPKIESLKSASPMPWQGGRSWLFDIETGISGFNYYLYRKFERGRSGHGLQSKRTVRSGSYRPPSRGYIRKLLARFYNSFKR